MGLLRAAETAEYVHEYNLGLQFLSQASSKVSIDRRSVHNKVNCLEKRKMAGIKSKHETMPISGSSLFDADVKVFECSDPAYDKEAIEALGFVARYPAKQRWSQAFMSLSPIEFLRIPNSLIEDNKNEHDERLAWGTPVATFKEIPELLEVISERRTRLLYKLRRYEGSQ